jgi:enamine deaminase RidA (YjgF/YER057c/UK114 family)
MSLPVVQELFVDADHESRRAGLRLGDLVVAPFLEATPSSAEPSEERTASGIDEVLATMERVLEVAGATRADLARVTFFMRDVRERPVLNDRWARHFPDPATRPPHKYVPARLREGVDVALSLLALLGRDRRVLEVAGVVHGDPMSLGQVTGELVTSSRLFAAELDVASQLDELERRATALLAAAGADLDALRQLTFFVGSGEIADEVRRDLPRRAGLAGVPQRRIVVTDLGGGNGLPRVELIGLLPRESPTR